jgi:hypothetical protein
MVLSFKRGDRVKLTQHVATPLMKNRQCQTDWHSRKGTVVRVSRVTDIITVLWDDRASTDQWPFRALEKLE